MKALTGRESGVHRAIDFGLILAIAISIFTVTAVVPLLARLHVEFDLPRSLIALSYAQPLTDLFAWCKAVVVTFCAGIVILAFAGAVARKTALVPTVPLLPVGGLTAFLIASSIRSRYPEFILMGSPGLNEGLPVLMSYLVLFVAASLSIWRVRDLQWLIAGLGISAAVMSIIAVSELRGHSLLLDAGMKKYWLGVGNDLNLARDAHAGAAAMFGNSNYLGSYCAMIVPLFAALTLAASTRQARLAAFALANGSFALLLASNSRAGFWAAGVASLIILALLARRCLRRSWPWLLGLLGGFLGEVLLTPHLATTIRDPVERFSSAPTSTLPYTHVEAIDGLFHVALGGPELIIARVEDGAMQFRDDANRPLPLSSNGEQSWPTSARYGEYRLIPSTLQGYHIVTVINQGLKLQVASTPQGFRVLTRRALLTPEVPATLSLPVSETAFGLRGFIWARTLPLLRRTWLLGQGPGTFVLDYPNRDFGGFLRAFGAAETLIDKPHNFYLQFAHLSGNTSLFLLLAMFAAYSWQSVVLLSRGPAPGSARGLAAAFFAAFLGFVGVGLANDSMVGVTPIFWILWGAGHLANRRLTDAALFP